jgi:hypothetical protein
MGRMIACWIYIYKLKLAMGITHIGPNLLTQAFASPCHKCEGKFVYDKYGQKEPYLFYSHFVFNILSICDNRSHGNYLNQST